MDDLADRNASITDPHGVTPRRPGLTWSLLPALLMSSSAFFLFALEWRPIGYAVMTLALALCVWLDRELLRDLLLIGVGLIIVSTVSVRANVSWENMLLLGCVLTMAVAVPYLLSRFGYGDHAIRFQWLSGEKWTRWMWAYIVAVPVIGWLVLPYYFISSGTYLNWPPLESGSEIARFFAGVNYVGSWDEFFFICTIFALLSRHFSFWAANLLQGVIFVSFLWELGYQAWGPLLTAPFALLQAYLFTKTRSLLYVLCVHLLFDVVVFLSIIHARYPDALPIFLI
ncbi:CPBP family intramembrane glutamic endopeptidase [Parenemella sanctibonifatiensis]|uniref:CPBP family intramembrane glutamic endopeptidase n=1 Tax=Parenemella sanctibonifatiensis TaxID=2016505 RepID=UPI001186AF2E|nr:CPBP family intramembrane glutamic endopeptidase [Parenemella sanctibonifatiensis]